MTAAFLGVLGASMLAIACQEGAGPLIQTRGGLEFHYESPTRTTITLTRGGGHDITVTVDRADQGYSLDVHQAGALFYRHLGPVGAKPRPGQHGFDNLSEPSARDLAKFLDELGKVSSSPNAQGELDPQGQDAVTLARTTLLAPTGSSETNEAAGEAAPSCISRDCVGACGAGCSPITCSCQFEQPPTLFDCQGTTGVYRSVSAYRCYTSACCQFHDACLGDNGALCTTDWCLACDAAAVQMGCGACVGLGYNGCSSGGSYDWFDETPSYSYVSNDPSCCNSSSCDATCQDPSQGGQPWLSGACSGASCGSCFCDANRCNDYCAQRNGAGSVGTCIDLGSSSGCSCSLPPTCTVSCDTNCGQPANVPPGCPPTNCPNTDTCTEATCGTTVCGQQCPDCCTTMDECGVCNGPGKVCGQCNYTGPTGGCDGCGNVWYDDCGVMCGDGSSCGCNGSVNACGECNGPTGGCDGCGNVWYDACGQFCGDGSECGPPGGGFCPDYGAGLCWDNPAQTISAGGNLATNSTLQRVPEEHHRRSPEERAARAADAVRLLEAWRLEATHRLKMTPAERVQLGKILEHQITALLQREVSAGGARHQAQLQANAGVAKLFGAQRFARYEAVRTEWMTRNQAKPSRGSAH